MWGGGGGGGGGGLLLYVLSACRSYGPRYNIGIKVHQTCFFIHLHSLGPEGSVINRENNRMLMNEKKTSFLIVILT